LWYTKTETQGDALQLNNFLDMEIKAQQLCWQWFACIPLGLVMLFDQTTQHDSSNFCSRRVFRPVWTKWYFVSIQYLFLCRPCNEYFFTMFDWLKHRD
jgi:hypothetical protein